MTTYDPTGRTSMSREQWEPRSNNAWVVFGTHEDDRGNDIRVGTPVRDLRLHGVISGSTGSGKSTLAANLAFQTFLMGHTTFVIEPHGDLCLDPKEGIIAKLSDDQLEDVILLDLSADHPFQINLATAGMMGSGDATLAVDAAMRCISVVEGVGFEQAVKMREYLENGLAAVLDVFRQEAGMVHMQRFLADDSFRSRVLDRVSDDAAEARLFWRRRDEKMHGRRGKSADDDMETPLRRVGRFLRNGYLRRSLSMPPILPGSEFDLAKVVESRTPKLVLLPLQSAKLRETVKRVFGTLFMSLLANCFLARSDQLAGDRQTIVIIIDEFPDLAPGEVGEIVGLLLAQARKYGAAVFLLAQFLNQLPPRVLEEVKENANCKIILRASSAESARVGANLLGGVRPSWNDIVALERYHGYAQVMVRGQRQPPYSFKALPPLSLPPMPHSPRGVGKRPRGTAEQERVEAFLAHSQEREAIELLVSLPDSKFRAAVAAQRDINQFYAECALADPEAIPDKVMRARQVSAWRNGLHRTFYEAQYRRIRF